jgi:hypothetical protein
MMKPENVFSGEAMEEVSELTRRLNADILTEEERFRDFKSQFEKIHHNEEHHRDQAIRQAYANMMSVVEPMVQKRAAVLEELAFFSLLQSIH